MTSSSLELVHTNAEGTSTYRAHIVYEYTIANETYQGTRPLFGYKPSSDRARHQELCRDYPPGQTVRVFYDPTNSARAVLDRQADWLVIVVCLFLGIMAVAAVLHNVLGPSPNKEFPEMNAAREPLAADPRDIQRQFARQRIRIRLEGTAGLSIIASSGRSKLMIQAASMAALILGLCLFVLLSIKDASINRYFFIGVIGLLEVFFIVWLVDLLLVGIEVHVRDGHMILRTRLAFIPRTRTFPVAEIAAVRYASSMSSGELKYYDIHATLTDDRDLRLAAGILGEDRVRWLTERIRQCTAAHPPAC